MSKLIFLEIWFITGSIYSICVGIRRGWITEGFTKNGERLRGVDSRIAGLFLIVIGVVGLLAAGLVYGAWKRGRLV